MSLVLTPPVPYLAGTFHTEPPPLATSSIPPSLARSSPLLDSLLKVSRRTEQAQSAHHSYLVPSFDLSRPSTSAVLPIEELRWQGATVVWYQGGSVFRTYSFKQQGQDVVQALFAYFEVEDSVPDLGGSSGPVASTSTASASSPAFGPFRRPPPPAWTDDPLALPIHPTSSRPPPLKRRERHLIIFLSDIAFAYPPSGGSVPFQLPFHLRRAWALEVGIILERAAEGKEVFEKGSRGEIATLYSLSGPAEEMKVVSSTLSPRMEGEYALAEPVQDLREQVVLVSDRRDGSEPLLVTSNAGAKTISVWGYERVDQSITGDGSTRGEDQKGKGRQTNGHPHERRTSVAAPTERSISTSKRKRPSYANASQASVSLGDRDRVQRRASTVGALASTSLAVGTTMGGVSTEEADLLEALGDTMATGVRRTVSAMSAVDRRTSITRNELSVTLDRMALGIGMGLGGGEMEREPTLVSAPEPSEAQMVPSVILRKLFELQTEHAAGAIAYLFDTRSTSTLKTSTLAILTPSSQTLKLFLITCTSTSPIRITFVRDMEATYACAILSTRPLVLDLLVYHHEGAPATLVTADAVLTQSVSLQPFETALVSDGHRIVGLEGNGSTSVVFTLSNNARHISMIPDVPQGVERTYLQALALVLDLKSFESMRRMLVAPSDGTTLGPGLSRMVFERDESMSTHDVFRRKVEESATCDPIFANLRSTAPSPRPTPSTGPSPAVPFKDQLASLWALHLLAEEFKLRKSTQGQHAALTRILLPLAHSLRLSDWVDYYSRILGVSIDGNIPRPQPDQTIPAYFPTRPPDIIQHLAAVLTGRPIPAWLDISHISSSTHITASFVYGDVNPCPTTHALLDIYQRLSPNNKAGLTASRRTAAAVLDIDSKGWTIEEIDGLAFGVTLPLREAIRLCQLEAPEGWPARAYHLIRRPDLAKQTGREVVPGRELTIPEGSARKEGDAPELVTVLKATRFNEDRRLEEVERMLQYAEPVTISAGDRTLDQLTPQVQQGILSALSNRTLSLPVGYAMFHYHARSQLASDTIPIPRINTSARILPMSSPVALVDKEHRDASSNVPSDRFEWPDFHSGVAAALQLHSGSPSFDSAQISFNKPAELDARHAGFLMGLGLVGHIGAMVFNQAFEYLKMKHDPTSIGLLLGLAVTYVGTGDPKVNSLLSVHLAALHPPGSSPLNVSGITQAAGLVGIGILYLGTARRSLADTMVRELCAIKVTSIEDPTACREAYALSAGFAFGMIMLGHGQSSSETSGEVGLVRTFRALILGESNHPLPGAAPSLNVTDVNITSSAATIAVGLMFLRTERQDIADILEIPDTTRRLDYVRSDLLLLRTLARSLIMWRNIASSKEWVESHVPAFIIKALASTGGKVDGDLEIARWNVIAGACFAMGLKFAGTATAEAHATLIHYLDRLTRAGFVKAATIKAKSKRQSIRCCLSVVAISLSMVMAGTGEINVLRRLRVAHGHFSEGVTYGTHLASHMALGLLFVGSGHYTLGTSNSAVATLLLAFYPSFPATSSENRAHLQAYRHLWTLAVEPRCLQVRDVDTNEPVFLPVRLRLIENGNTVRSKQLVAPTLIPELRLIDTIQIDSPRYWGFSLHLASNPDHLASFLKTGTLYVKRRTGHLNYAQDPRGIRSIFTRSKSETGSSVFDFGEQARTLAPSASGLRDFVSSFSDDPESITAVQRLCHSSSSSEGATAFEAFCASVLLECLTRDKRDTISVYHSLYNSYHLLLSPSLSPIALLEREQARFIIDFYLSGTYKSLFGKPKGKSSTLSRESLVQAQLVQHLVTKSNEIGLSLLVDPVLTAALEAYLGYSTWPTEERVGRRLALCLSLQGAPSIATLRKLRGKVTEVKVAGGELEEVRLLVGGTCKAFVADGGRGWSSEFGDLAVEVWWK